MARTVGCNVWFDWNFDGTFTDESANLVDVRGEQRLAPPEQSISGGGGMVDECTITLRNTAGRYSSLNTGGALYTDIRDGKLYHVPVLVEVTIDGSTWRRVFTGVAKIPQETGGAVDGIPTVRFTCRSRDELLLQQRMSTSWSTFRALYDSGASEAASIAQFLSDAGATGTALDPGLVTIPLAWLDAESPLEDMWGIAAAAGGRFYCDETGTFRYENMAHWLRAPHTTVQQAYTRDDWTAFAARWEDRELFDSVTVEYAGRQAEAEVVLWEADELVTVPPTARSSRRRSSATPPTASRA